MPEIRSGAERAEENVFCVAGNIYYRPQRYVDRRARQTGFPSPHIRPRARRPQHIHISSYPPGYIPSDLLPRRSPNSKKLRQKQAKREQKQLIQGSKAKDSQPCNPPRRTFDKLFEALRSHLSAYAVANGTSRPNHLLPPARSKSEDLQLAPPASPGLPMATIPPLGAANNMPGAGNNLPAADSSRPPMLAAALANSHRYSVMSARSAKNIMSSSVAELPKPVASGSGVSCSIVLAEPNVFLTGFEHDHHVRQEASNSSALLRGKLQLNVSKNVKLKSVTLKLAGRARTEWPEGIPPMKVDQHQEESLRTQVLTFFNALHETWETDYGNQCTYALRDGAENNAPPPSMSRRRGPSPPQSSGSLAPPRTRAGSTMTAREYKRLSLSSVQSRSFGKGDVVTESGPAQPPKGYKVFYPGTYEYNFELPIDHHQLETTKLQFGSVKWELEAIVERAGAFKPNLHGTKEVRIVRVPDQLSLEMTEPISISRQWEDQLHYDIMISGKSFPIGTKIPIAFKLTPLAKVQVHKLKVFVTESVEYWTNDRRVTRKDPGRKILLLEKAAGKPLDKHFGNSDIRTLSGGELSPRQRAEARVAAQRRRSQDAARGSSTQNPLPEPADNLLGDLDLGLESYWGSTEMEMNVQIPTCEQMAKDKTLRLHPDCSWKNVNVFHWIKIVMRISRLDPEDPSGKRRRHFEISIDSPFTVLDCRATQANTALPEYSGADQPMYRQQTRCGCPDAEVVATNPSPASSTGTIPAAEPAGGSHPPRADSPGITAPPAAHVQTHPAAASQSVQRTAGPQSPPRPMHLMRYPSFNPPAFDAEEPPPPMPTPPPQYDTIVGTPSVDGLADYFSRLAEYDDGSSESDEDDDVATPGRLMERSGRVNVPHPRTPGGRSVPSRSFEIERPPVPTTLTMAGALRERRA